MDSKQYSLDEINFDYITNEFYLMDKGVRNACLIDFNNSQESDFIKDLCNEYGYHPILWGGDEHASGSILVCKYIYQIELAREMSNKLEKHSFLYEYILGKLLGYTDESMEQYLTQNGCTDKKPLKDLYKHSYTYKYKYVNHDDIYKSKLQRQYEIRTKINKAYGKETQ